jgi:hypothetical protein
MAETRRKFDREFREGPWAGHLADGRSYRRCTRKRPRSDEKRQVGARFLWCAARDSNPEPAD